MQLRDGDYELDGVLIGNLSGIEGRGMGVILESGDYTSAIDVRDQDVLNPRGDSIWFGTDRLTPPQRSLVMLVDTTDPLSLDRLLSTWRADPARLTPGVMSELRWMHGGVLYAAHGRPRQVEVVGKKKYDPTYSIVNLTFQYADSFTLVGEPHEVTLGLYASSSGGCLILPAMLPWTLGASPAEATGVVVAQGSVPSPFTVRVRGPISGAASRIRIWGDGWELDFGTLTLKPLSELVIDTGRGVALLDGRNVAGRLSRASTLLGRIKPGPNTMHMTVDDPTSTTTAVVSWRDAAAIF